MAINRTILDPKGSAVIGRIVEGITRLTLITPTIHVGGTSKQELMEQRSDFKIALINAREKLTAVVPHPRDYYNDASGRLQYAADEQYRRRADMLNLLIEEMDRELDILIMDL